MLANILERLTEADEIKVSQAHLVVGVKPRTVFRWLEQGALERLETDTGVYVNVGDLRRVSAEKRPGRPARKAA